MTESYQALVRKFNLSFPFNTTNSQMFQDDSLDLFNAANTGGLSRFSRVSLNLAAICTILISIVGVSGNFLTIIALLRCPRVRNVAAAFIISLCVADFVFCLLVLPFNASRFIYGTWVHGDILCTIVPFVQYGNVGVSLLFIAMITINRYIMIAHYRLYNCIYKPVWIACMIIFCYALSFGMQVPTLLGIWGSFAKDERLGTCSIIPDAKGRSSKTTLFIIGFVIPCLIIICCYAKIFWVVRSSEIRMRRHNVAANNDRTRKETRDIKAKRNEWKITKMVLVIFLSFLICYLPITIVKVLDSNVTKPVLHVISYIFLYLSACINPIIYVIMNKQYRVAYKTVLMCKRPRLLSITHHTNGTQNQNKFADRDDQSKTILSSVQCSIAMTQMKSVDLSDVFLDDNK